MLFYSTNNKNLKVSLREAVLNSLASDNGLYMPEKIPVFPPDFFSQIKDMSLPEIGFEVSKAFFDDDINTSDLETIVFESLNFPVPLVRIKENLSTLELFHGPTLAFKDVGARFMARMMQYFSQNTDHLTHVLVATSGDTGSAVANGFLGVEGVHVTVLYPKGLVSPIQECQFTTLGNNITALEIAGTFDDCQHLVKQAFLDKDLNRKLTLTSANSINLARLIPQSFYYFYGLGQMKDRSKDTVICVPSGNFGNLTAALFAKRMGLPVAKFIAATNVNDIVPKYLQSGKYDPKVSVATIANAMDVGNPSNFVRMLDLYEHNAQKMAEDIIGCRFTDEMVRKAIVTVYEQFEYLMDPHGAIGYMALDDYLKGTDKQGFFIETAHPAKFKDTVEAIIQKEIEIPSKLKKFMEGKKQSISLSKEFIDFKDFLLQRG